MSDESKGKRELPPLESYVSSNPTEARMQLSQNRCTVLGWLLFKEIGNLGAISPESAVNVAQYFRDQFEAFAKAAESGEEPPEPPTGMVQ